MAFTARVFRIVQRADLLNLTKIEEALKHLTIKRYAYIMHDKDTYVADDVEKEREALTSFFSNAVEVNLRTANSLESDIGLRSKLTRVMADGAEQFVLQDRVNLSEVDFIDKYNSTVVGSLKSFVCNRSSWVEAKRYSFKGVKGFSPCPRSANNLLCRLVR